MVDSGEEAFYDAAVVAGGPGENLVDVATRNGRALPRPGEAVDALRRVPGVRDAAEGQIDLAEALDEHGRDYT